MNPKSYSLSDKVQKKSVSSLIEEFTEELKNINGKCMDIGCGPGDITKDILLPALGLNAQIIGTDISEIMVTFANKMFNDKRLQFEVLNIETKNLPKKYIYEFDHIFSFHTLHWCNDIQQAFKNIYDMLRLKGTILFYIIASHDIFDILKILIHDSRFSQYIPDAFKNILPYYESKNVRKEVKDSLQSIGFEVYHCSLREVYHFEEKSKEPNCFLNSILSILSFLDDMPQDIREEFKNELTCKFMKKTINYKSLHNNEEFQLDLYTSLVVYAQKT